MKIVFCKNFSFLISRKRSLSDCQHEDLDSTRDSVLSDQSHFSATEANHNEPNPNEPELMIIDFEYCAYNYRGFDLANHFIEWMLDYSNKEFPFFFYKKEQYPNKEQQVWLVKFLSHNFIENQKFNPISHLTIFDTFRSDSSNHIWWKWHQIQTTHQPYPILKDWKMKYNVSHWHLIYSGHYGHLLMFIKILSLVIGWVSVHSLAFISVVNKITRIHFNFEMNFPFTVLWKITNCCLFCCQRSVPKNQRNRCKTNTRTGWSQMKWNI